jgi:TolB-like protein
MRIRFAWVGVALLVALVVSAAAAPGKPVLMVVYFDNLTGKPEQDVMRKGLADMIITDLVAYDGVTVVERDKLEAVLGELRLQSTRAFDPATRAKMGKLVGARYLISGSMLSVAPELRIDARLTDVTTGVDVTAASVRGAPERLFDLEQELVGKLTSSIDAKLADAGAARKMKGVDLETVLAYSKGLDLEDAGKLEEARKQYSEVLRRKPTFTLPRERTEKLLKKMAEAQTTRSTALSSAAVTLINTVEQTLAGNLDQLPEAKQGEYLELRILRGRLLGRSLQEHLVPKSFPSVVVKGHEAAALKLLREIHANYERLRDELARFRRQHTSGSPSLRLSGDLERIAREAHLVGSSDSLDESGLLRQWASFVLLGKVDAGEQDFTIGPALGDLEPKTGAAMLAALDREVASLTRSSKARAEHHVRSLLELEADALFRIGKTEDGVAKLQRFLDEYPTSTQFSNVTRKINVELGVERTSQQDDLLNYPEKGLKQCDYFALYRGWGSIIHKRIAVKGAAALRETVTEIERACAANKKIFWNNLYSLFALAAASYGDCDLSRELWQKYLDHNGSRSDLSGYQKWHPECVFTP